jgi:NAD(P)-dependent dehydrogenase (short-subunit alcohol dehydrogenase family)
MKAIPPDELAEYIRAALFLASDGARFITGALLLVDGGQSTRVG